MAILAKTKAGAKVFSMFEYRAYTDKDIFNKIESINFDGDKYNQDAFDSIIDELVKVYKRNIIFSSIFLRNIKYISYVKSTEKFNKINQRIICELSKKLGLEIVDICDYNDAKSDVRDAYIKEDNTFNIKLNKQYHDKPILIFDLFCSTGYLIDEIYKKYNFYYCYFLTIGIRFDCIKLTNTRIVKYEDTDFEDNKLFKNTEVDEEPSKNDFQDYSYTNSILMEEKVTIINLFGKKNVELVFKSRNSISNKDDRISIYIGDNGYGKSTALRIAQLALDDNYDSYFKLSKYAFDKIIVKKTYKEPDYERNDYICKYDERIINYDSLIPSKKKILDSFDFVYNDNIENSSKYSLLKICFEKFYLESDYKILTDVNKIKNFTELLKILKDDDYKKLFIKMRQNDNTYKKDLNRLASEITGLANKINFTEFIEYFEAFNNSIFTNFDDNYIEKNNSTYINVTSNRGIKPTLSKDKSDIIKFVEDDDDYLYKDDFFEEFYDEDSYESKQEELEEIKAEAWSRYEAEVESDDDYNDYPDYMGDSLEIDYDLYASIYEEVEREYLEQEEADEEMKKDHMEAKQADTEFFLSTKRESLSAFVLRHELLSSFFDAEFVNRETFNVKLDMTIDEYKSGLNKKEIKIGEELILRVNRFKENILYDNPFAFPIVNLENIIKYSHFGKTVYDELKDLFIYDVHMKSSTNDEKNSLKRIFHNLRYQKNKSNPRDETSFILEMLLKDTVESNKYLIDYSSFDFEEYLDYLDSDSNVIYERNIVKKHNVCFDREDCITNYIETIDFLKHFSFNFKLLRLEKIINKYLVEKRITFINNSLYIIDMDNHFIPLNYLSAGEKNLILILSQCALSNKDRLIFDEPDLSMHIGWQENLILDMKKLFDGELIIATQSPQLVRNSYLHKYVKSMRMREVDGENDELR